MWHATIVGKLPHGPSFGRLLSLTAKPWFAFSWTTTVIPFLLALSTPVLATEVKTMECEKYVVGANGLKDKWSIFTFSLSPEENTISIQVKRDGGSFLLPEYNGWKVIWKSADNLRAVAMFVREPQPQSLESPVVMLDLDWKNGRFKQMGIGGIIDFDEVVYSPWKYECRRLD